MNRFSKLTTGAAAAALMTLSFAAPAEAQFRDRYRDRSITNDLITGVAILGGIAAITNALGRDGQRYGYGYRDRYRDDYRNAVNSCGYEAERAGRGRVSITDVDRRGNYSYRVRGVIDAGYDTRGYGYDNRGYGYDDRRYGRYDRNDRYGGYDNRYGGYDSRYGGYDNRYDRYGRYDRTGRYGYDDRSQQIAFSCTARGDGRIRDFRFDNAYASRYGW